MDYLGIDIGFGEVKAVVLNRELEVLQVTSFPTLIAGYTPAPLEKEKKVFDYGGRRYVLGQDARGEPSCFQLTDFEDIKEFGPLLFRGVIERNGIKAGDVVVCASIAPGWWPEREELATALRGEEPAVVVVPQGQGAFVAARRENNLEGAENVLVLDFGYNTVDYLWIEVKGDRFEVTRGNTLPRLGVMRLVKLFKKELRGELRELPDHTVKEMLRVGQGKLYGDRVNLAGEKRRGVEKYCAMLMRELKNDTGELWRETDILICTGGGVYYFEPRKNLPHHRVVIPSELELANARGQAIWIAEVGK